MRRGQNEDGASRSLVWNNKYKYQPQSCCKNLNGFGNFRLNYFVYGPSVPINKDRSPCLTPINFKTSPVPQITYRHSPNQKIDSHQIIRIRLNQSTTLCCPKPPFTLCWYEHGLRNCYQETFPCWMSYSEFRPARLHFRHTFFRVIVTDPGDSHLLTVARVLFNIYPQLGTAFPAD